MEAVEARHLKGGEYPAKLNTPCPNCGWNALRLHLCSTSTIVDGRGIPGTVFAYQCQHCERRYRADYSLANLFLLEAHLPVTWLLA